MVPRAPFNQPHISMAITALDPKEGPDSTSGDWIIALYNRYGERRVSYRVSWVSLDGAKQRAEELAEAEGLYRWKVFEAVPHSAATA